MDTTTYPYSAIAYLRITFPDRSVWSGTAWFIGPYTLMTCAHNVYANDPDQPSFGWATSIEVMPGCNGDVLPFGSVTAAHWWATGEWVHNRDSNYDYGAIVIPTDLGNTVNWFGFQQLPDEALLARTANVCGYPGEMARATMWCDAKPVSSVDGMNVYYTGDTTQGQSGSPVYSIEDGGDCRPQLWRRLGEQWRANRG